MKGIMNESLWDESYELEQMIIRELSNGDALTDEELAERLKSKGITLSVCNNLCLQLAAKGIITRDRAQGKSLVNQIKKGEREEPEQLILGLLRDEGDLTDKELAERLTAHGVRPYTCLQLCFQLNLKGLIKRVSIQGKPLVNRIVNSEDN